MIHNDVLRSVRFMLGINDVGIANILELGGCPVPMRDIVAFMKKEDEPGYLECPNDVMSAFLDGLVIYRRGPADGASATAGDSGAGHARPDPVVTNNTVLKKLRVAFELKEEDVLALLESANLRVSKHELRALFRHASHPNHRVCGDQFLRNFLRSLAARLGAARPS